MKKRLALLLCASAALAVAGDGAMTSSEREYLLGQLETSKSNMLASIAGLSDAQWKFKPAPNVWSVAECAEHIILAEDYIFGGAQQVLKTPAVPRPARSNAEFDRGLVAGVLDRSKKATAPEPIVPSGKFATPADAAREFTARRDKTIEYVKTTADELRVHVADGPAGPMDSYQFLLLLAAHSGRHTLQIQEVQANPGYPKTE
jgi:DinB superfamily